MLLLHGPVGSSKSTIARLLKKGLERYSARDDGAATLYAGLGQWPNPNVVHDCPMHEEPLHLIPDRFRKEVADELNSTHAEPAYQVTSTGNFALTVAMSTRID